jgi:hypothetical protein
VSAEGLLRELRELGATVATRGDRLAVDAPAGAVTPDLRADLAAHKGDLLALLARERFAADPRPDLANDSARWARLLALAYDRDGEDPRGLFGALHGLRCCGAGLAPADDGARLVAGEMPAEEYAAGREAWLVPHAAALTALLRAV